MSPIEQKIDKIHDMVHQQNVAMAEFVANQKIQGETLKSHSQDIKVLNTYKDNAAGKQSILAAVWGTVASAVTAVVTYLIKN